jgi:hypothetical protein
VDYNRYLLTGDQRDLRASRLVKGKEEISVYYNTECNVMYVTLVLPAILCKDLKYKSSTKFRYYFDRNEQKVGKVLQEEYFRYQFILYTNYCCNYYHTVPKIN